MSTLHEDPLASLYAALRTDPNSAALHNSLGCIFYKRGQINEAIPVFSKSIRLSPDSWEAHFNLGNCYVKKDLIDQAITHYLAALEINPQYAPAQTNLAMVYVSQKDYTKALPHLESAASRDTDFAELQGHLAEAYLDLGMTQKAIAQYKRAIDLEPNRAPWLHNLAVLYLREHDTANAVTNFAASLKLDPDNKTAMHMLNAITQQHTSNAPIEYISDLFDQYADYYNKHVIEQLEYVVPAKLRQAIGAVVPTTSIQLSVLDLGCGTGLCGLYFRDLAYYLVGVDLSTAMLDHAKATGAYDALCCYDICQAIPGQNDQAFDVIIAADVLVYLGDLNSIFDNVSRSLRKKGIFAFTVESGDTESFTLQTTGRFAHAPSYIAKIAKLYSFTILSTEHIILRKNRNESIQGDLFVFQYN